MGTTDRGAIDEDLAAFGMRLEGDLEDEAVEVWPDHWDAKEVATAMMSQINVSMAGPVGWRYESLPVVFRMLGVPLARQREMFDDLRVIEAEVVAVCRERQA